MNAKIDYVPRMEGLDALRGFALFGLFIVHMPELFELYWAHPATDPSELRWHDAIFGLFGGKAFALLALCFGVSFYIIMERAAAKGGDFSARFAWRMLLLGLIGLVHGLWYRGDILEVLAVMGLLLIPFFKLPSNRSLLAWSVFFLAQPLMIFQIVCALLGADWANRPLGFWSASMPAVYTTEGAGLVETIKANIGDGHHFKWLFMYESGRLSQILGLSILGLVLGRTGYFRDPARHADLRAAGFALSLIALALLFHWRADLTDLMPASATLRMPRSLWGAMLAGWMDLATMFSLFFGFTAIYDALQGRWLNALAPAGRMTLTLYLLQSLLFVPVFYGFGLNLHASMSQGGAVLLGVIAFGLQLAGAHWWFRHYFYGPVEWLWRAGTWRTLQVPFKKPLPPSDAAR